MQSKYFAKFFFFIFLALFRVGLDKVISQPIYFYGSSKTNMQNFGKLLNIMGADFFQLTDSLRSFNFKEDIYHYYDSIKNFSPLYSGSLKNIFTGKYGVSITYQIYPISNNKKVDRFNDNNITADFLKKIEFRRKMYSSRKKLCIDSRNFVVKNLIPGKAIKQLNADSVCIVQFIYPFSGLQDKNEGCVAGLNKELIFYKKGRGIIVLDYSFANNEERKSKGPIDLSFKQASKLLDLSIRKTWGIIRFK